MEQLVTGSLWLGLYQGIGFSRAVKMPIKSGALAPASSETTGAKAHFYSSRCGGSSRALKQTLSCASRFYVAQSLNTRLDCESQGKPEVIGPDSVKTRKQKAGVVRNAYQPIQGLSRIERQLRDAGGLP